MTKEISKLATEKPAPPPRPYRGTRKPGPAAVIPEKTNPGLEEAIAICKDNVSELARRIETSPANILAARGRGWVTADMALAIFKELRVKLSKLLRRRYVCPHCQKEI